MISVILDVLLILENGIEVIHALSSQKANMTDHTCHTPDRESTSTKANEDDLIARRVVGSNERVNFADILPQGQSYPVSSVEY